MVKIKRSERLFSAVDFVADIPIKNHSQYYKTVIEIKQDTITATDGARLHQAKIPYWHGLTEGYYNIKVINQNCYALSFITTLDNAGYYPKYQFLFNATYETYDLVETKEDETINSIVFKIAGATNTEKKCYNLDFFRTFPDHRWLLYVPKDAYTFLTAVSTDNLFTAFIMPIKM